MNYLPRAAKVAGHLAIVALCILTGLALTGRYVSTVSTLDGVPTARLGVAEATQAIQSGAKLGATTTIAVFDKPLVVKGGAGVSLLLTLATPVILVLLVYLPGVFWRPASRLPIRIGMALVVPALLHFTVYS